MTTGSFALLIQTNQVLEGNGVFVERGFVSRPNLRTGSLFNGPEVFERVLGTFLMAISLSSSLRRITRSAAAVRTAHKMSHSRAILAREYRIYCTRTQHVRGSDEASSKS